MANLPRVTQHITEAVQEVDSPLLQFTQQAAEAVQEVDSPLLQFTQIVVEVVHKAAAPEIRLTQEGMDVARRIPTPQPFRISQIGAEIGREEPPSDVQISQIGIEFARPSRGEQRLGLQSWMVFDKVNTIEVLMISGVDPVSAPDDLFVLNSNNVGQLGKEIIQWVNVEDLGERRYRLSRLLRGRLGTELFMNSHSPNETFVIFDPVSVQRVVGQVTDLNVQRYFKIIGAGLPSFNQPIIPFVNTGVSLRPWKAVFVKASRDGSGNITLTWVRRTRVNWQLVNFVGTPLGEAEERYEIDIINSSGAVVRTLNSTVQQVEYSAVDQVTDFGSVQDPVAVTVYQMSVTVGRGYPSAAVV